MSKLKKLIAYLMSYLPTKLPLGLIDFDDYFQAIRGLADSRLSNVPDDDIRFVVASTITHQGPTGDRMPKQKMVRILHAAAAKQVAAQIFQDVKQRQRAQQEADAKAQAEKDQPAQD